MKRIILCLLAASVSQVALAKDYSGKLRCFVNVMDKKTPGLLESPRILGGSDNIEKTVLGPAIVVDLDQASKATVTSISKTLISDKNLSFPVDFFLSFQYKGKIAAGNLVGIRIVLSQKGKTWGGDDVILANADVSTGIPEDVPTHLEISTKDSGLMLATVECGVAAKE